MLKRRGEGQVERWTEILEMKRPSWSDGAHRNGITEKELACFFFAIVLLSIKLSRNPHSHVS